MLENKKNEIKKEKCESDFLEKTEKSGRPLSDEELEAVSGGASPQKDILYLSALLKFADNKQ